MGHRPSLTTNVLFEILADEHRRATIRVLLDADQADLPLEARELARRVAGVLEDAPASDVTAEDIGATLTVLLHVHFPKLSRHGVVEYDEGDRLVGRGANCERFRAPLESVGE